jgi:hypothetical protein
LFRDLGYTGILTTYRKVTMFYILKKFKYIRGYEHEVPFMTKDGYDSQEKAEQALAALEVLEPRPDLVTYIIVRDL